MKILIVLFSFVLFVSCEKSESSSVSPNNLTLLTGGSSKKWNIVLYKVSNVSGLKECDKDDIFTFSKTEKSYTQERNKVKCDPTEINSTRPFSISADNFWIKIGNEDYSIDKLDAENLQITGTFSNKVYVLGYKAIK